MERLELFRVMLLARRFEERLAALYRQGRIAGGVYLGKGQEAISGALGLALDQKTTFLRRLFVIWLVASPLAKASATPPKSILAKLIRRCVAATAIFIAVT